MSKSTQIFCLLDPRIAPSEILSECVQFAEPQRSFPFDEEPRYAALFSTIARALCRGSSGNVLLIAERGVGASTILAEFARRTTSGQIRLSSRKDILSVDGRYTAPYESRERLNAILSQLGDHPDLIVCLDGFASLLRSDRAGGNKPGLLSALSRIRCQLIGILTPNDYEELVADDPEMLEFFTPVVIEEPDVSLTTKLLSHYAVGLGARHGVVIEDSAIHNASVLSANYILNERLPAKALKILQRICEDIDFERLQNGCRRDRITAEDVLQAVAERSGVPEETLRGIAEQTNYEESLQTAILGQDHAVREVATELGLIKAGLTDSGKPASVMMFIGQTGTGKTEMAKVLARFYSTSKRLKTYTLGNFVESHSVAGIIGVPPGYVGHDQGGRIVNDLNADPYCVFLLDEADKAHPDVMQPFLNLFDEGWVVDQRGRKAYADRAIFILTTNVGQRQIADMAAQGKSVEEITTRMKESLAQIRHTKSNRPVFPPEFLARIKRTVVFLPLSREAMEGICRKLIAQMQQTWRAKRGKDLLICEEIVAFITNESHAWNERSKGREGGRIVRKLLSEIVEAPLQRKISLNSAEYLACQAVIVRGSPASGQKTATPASADVIIEFQ